MEDILLEKVFEPERWENAIKHGVEKDINKTDLQTLCDPRSRAVLYALLKNGQYTIEPPRTALIPKDGCYMERTLIGQEEVQLSFDERKKLLLCHVKTLKSTGNDLDDLMTPDTKSWAEFKISALCEDDIDGWKSWFERYSIPSTKLKDKYKETAVGYRTVYICSNLDRVFLSIVNNLFFEMCHDMVHKSCKSYQTGIGTGKVVREVSSIVCNSPTVEVGYKTDLSKYFDTPRIELIDGVFDKIEERCGKSVVIDVVRKFYHDNRFYTDGVLHEEYKSIKQGTATSSFLADALLYDVDEAMSNMDTYYVRYSDDCLILGGEWRRAFEVLSQKLSDKGLTLNPKKVEVLRKDTYFKFLGFSIRGKDLSISKGRLETFKKEIQKRTVKRYLFDKGYTKALHSVLMYLYGGEYSWASSVLTVINVKEDIDNMNAFVMDMLRACKTGKYNKKFGLGYEPNKYLKGVGLRNGVVTYHPIGSAGTNRKLVEHLDGYLTLGRMRKMLLTSRQAYDTLVRSYI